MEATTNGRQNRTAGLGEQRKRGQGEGKGHPATVAAVMDALELLSSGRAKSKAEAASIAGISVGTLSPQSLSVLFASAPEFAQTNEVGLLDIVHDGNGQAESVRQSLSRGVVAAAGVLGRVAGRVGSLDRDDKEALKQARDWLSLCRESGLWAANNGPALPGELRDSAADRELDLMTVDRWLRDYGRRDGIGPTAEKVLTERQSLKSPLPVAVGEDDQS